jgi:pyruvate formate lyase activating enzyme
MRLANSGLPLLLRTPIIPTVNDNYQDISSIAEFIGEMTAIRKTNGADQGIIEWELLPFHQLAQDKYQGMGLEYNARDLPQLSSDELQRLEAFAFEVGAPIRLSRKA